jgi:putative hydrolase of the HAD superfamily
MRITTLFWDLGGVLLSNGWDREQRARATEQFGLDAEDFEDRHREMATALETGRTTLDAYLRATVFSEPRDFGPAEFREFMLSQSLPFEESLQVLAALAGGGHYTMATINNESHELNAYRIGHFHLYRYFRAFFCSAFVGVTKPDPAIYRIALEVLQKAPGEVLFIDDRLQNLEPARALGMRTLHFHGEDGGAVLREGLRAAGVEV